MNEKKPQNLKLKIIAVLFATALWMISININDPYQSKDYTVTVQLLNIGSMTGAGKYVEIINGSDEISVRVRGNRSVMDSFSSTNIVATADINEMDENNRVPIKLTTAKTSGSKIESIRSNDTHLEVKVENIKRIQKRLEVVTKNDPEEGYILGKVTTEQNALKISGPESAVAMVDKAVVNIDLTGATDDVSMILPVELYDAKGNRIADSRLSTSINEVQCVASVLSTKELPLVFTTKGSPAKGYGFTGEILCDTPTVVVAGKASALRGMRQLEIKEALDIQGATKDVTANIDVREFLKDNIILAMDTFDGRVEATAVIQETFETEVEKKASDIRLVNVPDGLHAEVKNKEENITIVVGGFISAKEGFLPENIEAKVDVLGYMNGENRLELASGTYSMDVKFELPENVWIQNDLQIEVEVVKK